MGENNDSPLTRKMCELIRRGRARGYITEDELHEAVPLEESTQAVIDRVLSRLRENRVYILPQLLEEDQGARDRTQEPKAPDPARDSRIRAAYESEQDKALKFLQTHGWAGSLTDLRSITPQRWHGEEG